MIKGKQNGRSIAGPIDRNETEIKSIYTTDAGFLRFLVMSTFFYFFKKSTFDVAKHDSEL